MFKNMILLICYYFIHPIWERESEEDRALTRAELNTLHGEVLPEG